MAMALFAVLMNGLKFVGFGGVTGTGSRSEK
jgi:hypothetical protein